MFKVYDDTKSLLATFNTESEAQKYVYNNDDIAAFINDNRVVEITHVPSETAAPYSAPTPLKSKLISAADALLRIKAAQEDTVNSIVEQVIEEQGEATFEPAHRLIAERLEELGFGVEVGADYLRVFIKDAT